MVNYVYLVLMTAEVRIILIVEGSPNILPKVNVILICFRGKTRRNCKITEVYIKI